MPLKILPIVVDLTSFNSPIKIDISLFLSKFYKVSNFHKSLSSIEINSLILSKKKRCNPLF
jgi:hypothetical protein